jgi:hypothetical protein
VPHLDRITADLNPIRLICRESVNLEEKKIFRCEDCEADLLCVPDMPIPSTLLESRATPVSSP